MRRMRGSSEDCPAPGALPDLPDLPDLPGSAIDCPIPDPATGSGSGSGNTLDVVTCAGSIKQGSYAVSVKTTKRTLTLPPGVVIGEETTVVDDPDCSESGSGSGSGTSCTAVLFYESDFRCEAGILYLYLRNVSVNIVDGCLTREAGDWYKVQERGCCECPDIGSGTGNPLCCSGPVTIYAGIDSISNCSCAAGVVVTLTRLSDGTSYQGSAAFGTCGGGSKVIYLLLQCISNRPVEEGVPDTPCNKYQLTYSFDGCASAGNVYPLTASPYECSCDPIDLTYELNLSAGCCDGASAAVVRIHITE